MGVLTIPYAISEGGWAAVLLLIILGIITNYTAKLLCDMQYRPMDDLQKPLFHTTESSIQQLRSPMEGSMIEEVMLLCEKRER